MDLGVMSMILIFIKCCFMSTVLFTVSLNIIFSFLLCLTQTLRQPRHGAFDDNF